MDDAGALAVADVRDADRGLALPPIHSDRDIMNQNDRSTGRMAILTGAAFGLGRATTPHLAAESGLVAAGIIDGFLPATRSTTPRCR